MGGVCTGDLSDADLWLGKFSRSVAVIVGLSGTTAESGSVELSVSTLRDVALLLLCLKLDLALPNCTCTDSSMRHILNRTGNTTKSACETYRLHGS